MFGSILTLSAEYLKIWSTLSHFELPEYTKSAEKRIW